MRFNWTFSVVALALIALTPPAEGASATRFKVATVVPEGSAWMEAMRLAASEIAERTEGRVAIKFYGGGIMGNDKKVLRKIRIGQLQGGVFTASGLSDRYPDLQIYGLPLIFQSQDEVDYIRARMDLVLANGLEDAGFVSFGFAGGGFAKLMGAQSVSSIESLRGKKVWIPEGDTISYQVMSALELSPVVLPITDVLTGLQTGLLEYIATPPVGAVILQWYTKVKYVMTLPLAYTLGLMVIDKRAFTSISADDQQVLHDVLTAVYEGFEEQNREDNIEAERALVANGLQLVDIPSEVVPQWREAARRANSRMAQEGVFSAELLHALRAYLAEYRSGAQAQAATSSGP